MIDETRILYEDNHLLALNKEAGQLVQGDDTGDIPMSEMIKAFLKEKYQKPGNVFCGIIHRIDRPVSGVVLFAKTSKALERMNESFRERHVQKTYWALTSKRPQQEAATLVHFLKKSEKILMVNAFEKDTPGTVRAELSYKLLHVYNNCALVEVNPITGRKHQIRVQLSSIDCPIIGDVKYGAPRPNSDYSICLHARQLVFNHPVSKEPITLIADPPAFWKEIVPTFNMNDFV
jgi:23S rRNA pseudouridine1911/1915/1917 synthase